MKWKTEGSRIRDGIKRDLKVEEESEKEGQHGECLLHLLCRFPCLFLSLLFPLSSYLF